MSSYSEKLRVSWELLQRSLRVLQQNPKLFLFPLVSALCALGIILFFFAPIVIVVGGMVWGGAQGADWNAIGHRYNTTMYLYGVAFYLVAMFMATFMNVAFYNEIFRALGGEPVSLSHGLRFAGSRLPAILLWSLLAGTVGLVIRTIEDRVGWLGKWMMAALGTVWSIAAVFAIPVIVRRTERNPITVLRDSVATLKRTWGESLAGWVGIRLGGSILVLLSIGLLVPALIIGIVLHAPGVMGIFMAVWALAIVAAFFLLSMTTHVYRCALYVYASEGVVPEPYTAEMMNVGWKVKKQ